MSAELLDSRDVDHDRFAECDPNRELVFIHCPRCRHLMAWCRECDTLFPDLSHPEISMPVTMLDSKRDRIPCGGCRQPFEDFFFLRRPAIGKYLVTRAEIVAAGYGHLLAT